ncbi:carbohydrate ABC transporter permease [Microbacterium sp. BR1]|uniref:carbohydrate ABC transporter permease n=1 Tax=Microbacterium sp. BR1 TaxID=1070896 RepID=UPI0012FDA5FF|nr:sugar ABC transporter permease [Microbacterium sp. BR1]
MVTIIALVGVVLAGLRLWDTASSRIRSPRTRERATGWVWLVPGLILLFIALIYPILTSIVTSFTERGGDENIWANYAWVFSPEMLGTLRNNLIWIFLLPPVTIIVGLIVAVLADRTSYERVVKIIVLIPVAVSFVAAASIWRYMYTYSPAGTPQRGTVNGIWTLFGADPVAWLTNPGTATFALIVVSFWLHLGYAVVLLSNAIKYVPVDLLEAARLDGAGELRILFSIIIPQITMTIVLLASMFMVGSLKAFDIVYAMTGGNYGTDVYATAMYEELFMSGNSGRAAAIAVVLFLIAVPIMGMNVIRTRKEKTV